MKWKPIVLMVAQSWLPELYINVNMRLHREGLFGGIKCIKSKEITNVESVSSGSKRQEVPAICIAKEAITKFYTVIAISYDVLDPPSVASKHSSCIHTYMLICIFISMHTYSFAYFASKDSSCDTIYGALNNFQCTVRHKNTTYVISNMQHQNIMGSSAQ